MGYLRFACFWTSLTSLLLGFFVFFRKKESPLKVPWLLMSFAVSVWSFFFAFLIGENDRGRALFFARVANSAALFIPIFFLSFVLRFVGKEKSYKGLLRVAFSLALLVLPFVPTVLFVKDVVPKLGLNFYVEPGLVYNIFTAEFLLTSALALYVLLSSLSDSSPTLIIQIKYVLVAGVLGFFSGGTSFLLVYNIRFFPWPVIFMWIYCAIIAYAILRHGLMDINVVVRKSLIYSLSVTVMTLIYVVVVYMSERLFQGFLGYHSVTVALAAFVCIALIFQPLKNQIQFLIDRYFFKGSQVVLARQIELMQEELRKGAQLKAIATLASGMAHEIKNPLTAIKTFVEYLPKKYQEVEFRDKFSRIVSQEVDRINDIVQQVLDFARPKPATLVKTDVSKLLDNTVNFLSSELLKRSVEVRKEYDNTHSKILLDPIQIRQVFLNLILNALEAMDAQPQRVLMLRTERLGETFRITIQDTGKGIPEKDLSRIFEPFYTTSEKGTGLGLSIVQGIVNEHGAKMKVSSDGSSGSTFLLEFPYDLE